VTKSRAFLGDFSRASLHRRFGPKKRDVMKSQQISTVQTAQKSSSVISQVKKNHTCCESNAVPKSPPESDSSLVQDEVWTGPKDGLCHLLDIEDLWNLIWRLLLGAPKV